MKCLLLVIGAGLVLTSTAVGDMEDCRFALHYKATTTKLSTLCTSYSPNFNSTPCEQYVTRAWTDDGFTTRYLVYMVIAHAGMEGVSGASFGIDYHNGIPAGQGIDPASTGVTWCPDVLPYPSDGGNGDFPAPDGGIRLTWVLPEGCQTTVIGSEGVHAVMGVLDIYVYSYSADQLQLTPNRNLPSGNPELTVTNCAEVTTDLVQLYGVQTAELMCGRIDYGDDSGDGSGYNPCLAGPFVPTARATWGRIKTKYSY